MEEEEVEVEVEVEVLPYSWLAVDAHPGAEAIVAGSEFEHAGSAQIRLFFTFIVQIQNCICELRF